MPQADPYAAELTLLLDHARAAGEIARVHHRTDLATWEKDGGAGPVTEADIAIDRMLKAELTRAEPDYGWLSEETEDDPVRCEADRAFIVDPIDGTRAFMRGDDSFCHALAVVDKGEVVAACAYFPIKDQMYWATKGGGAFRDGERITTSSRTEIDGAATLSGKPQMNPSKWPGGPPPVMREFRNSLVYRHCLVARGRFDLAFTLRAAWEWDVAAGDLILREAGAVTSDRTARALRFNNKLPQVNGVLAANPVLHGKIVSELAEGARPD